MSAPTINGGLLPGTLDMLILRTLRHGRAHGHDIARHIRAATRDVFRLEHGSLYPALHRLERKRLVTAAWERHPQRNREFRYYRLTAAGERHLKAETVRWQTAVTAVARVLWPERVEEG